MQFTHYQKRGIYPSAHPDIIPAILEISRGAGVPDISMYCLQVGGIGRHKTGHACDFQGGLRKDARYPQSVLAHQSIAHYTLLNWKRLRVRYMAWNGYEYLNGGRQRKQTKNYGGTDPFHKNHVHVDFEYGPIPGARPNIPIGASLSQDPNPATAQRYYTRAIDGVPGYYTYLAVQRFLADRGFFTGAQNGQATPAMWVGLQNFLNFIGHLSGPRPGEPTSAAAAGLQRWLISTGHYKAAITSRWDRATWTAFQTYLAYASKSTRVYTTTGGTVTTDPPYEQSYEPLPANTQRKKGFLMALSDKQQADVYKQTMNISAATRRSEDREREMLTLQAQQSQILLDILAAVSP